jgi:general secretion pathway protein L
MSASAQLAQGFSSWLDSVAGTVATLMGRLETPRIIEFVETDNGEFELRASEDAPGAPSSHERIRISEGQVAGTMSARIAAIVAASRVELVLAPDRFLFRPLELPARAADLLDGIVRAQIDRLTPWNATEAVFGWSKPIDAGADRIAISIAAIPRPSLAQFVQALAALGVQAIDVFTSLPDSTGKGGRIKVLEHRVRGALGSGQIRRALAVALLGAGLAAALATGASSIAGALLGHEQDTLARRIASLRAGVGAPGDIALGSPAAAQRMLNQRKHDMPSSVILLETLARILPDHTHATELRIEDNKLQLTGVTKDAPSLIGLLEQSDHFAKARFSAPTTRSPSDPGETFHIEAEIPPSGSPRS